jgi:hypothetical protein
VHRPGQTKPVSVQIRLSRDTIDPVMWEVVTQKAEAIKHAIDGKARFLDVAEILQKATGDVQLEIARRIQMFPQVSVADLHHVIDLSEAPPSAFSAPVSLPADFADDDAFVFAPLPAGPPKVVQLSLFGSML